MNATFTAITKQDNDWWIGWIEEVPGVNARERTKKALLASLREILREALQFNREEVREIGPRELHRGVSDRMKRREFLRHLTSRDCELVREGAITRGGEAGCPTNGQPAPASGDQRSTGEEDLQGSWYRGNLRGGFSTQQAAAFTAAAGCGVYGGSRLRRLRRQQAARSPRISPRAVSHYLVT